MKNYKLIIKEKIYLFVIYLISNCKIVSLEKFKKKFTINYFNKK